MDEFSVTSANLDQIDQDFLAHEVPDEIMEAAAEALNTCRIRRLAINDRRML